MTPLWLALAGGLGAGYAIGSVVLGLVAALAGVVTGRAVAR